MQQQREINRAQAEQLAVALSARGLRLVTVESCTGGLVAATLTSLPGSSNWFEGAFVTYRLSAKTRMVGVEPQLLAASGAVSEPTARAMAEGALQACDADLSVSITGVAGPDGGDIITPVGTVWFGWALRAPEIQCIQTAEMEFPGDRSAVRVQAVNAAIDGLLQILN